MQGFALNGVPLKETAPEFVPVAGFDFASFEHLIATDNKFMGMRGTVTGMKMTSSCMTPAINACSGSNAPGQDGSKK